MPSVQAAGLEAALTERGEGPGLAVVCVHSTGLSALMWRRLMRRLAKGHRVLAPDLIGYGGTPTWPGPGPFETRYDLEIVRACIDRLDDQPVHLVAHSYGGRLAMLAAAERPHQIASISCFEPVSFGVLRSTGAREGLEELDAYDHDGLFLDDDFGGTREWVERFVDYWNGQGAFAEMSERERDMFCASGRKMFEEVRETSTDDVPHTHYQSLRCRALFISGSQSTRAGRQTAEVRARELPQGRHVEIDAGHMAPLTASDEVNALILENIASVEAQR
jgi:pimeloyl-ACP methyl ester carboxylesterase